MQTIRDVCCSVDTLRNSGMQARILQGILIYISRPSLHAWFCHQYPATTCNLCMHTHVGYSLLCGVGSAVMHGRDKFIHAWMHGSQQLHSFLKCIHSIEVHNTSKCFLLSCLHAPSAIVHISSKGLRERSMPCTAFLSMLIVHGLWLYQQNFTNGCSAHIYVSIISPRGCSS